MDTYEDRISVRVKQQGYYCQSCSNLYNMDYLMPAYMLPSYWNNYRRVGRAQLHITHAWLMGNAPPLEVPETMTHTNFLEIQTNGCCGD